MIDNKIPELPPIECSSTDPLIVLLLLDLVHLLHQLSDSQLQLWQFVFGGNLSIVVGVFAHLDVQVNPLQHKFNMKS